MYVRISPVLYCITFEQEDNNGSLSGESRCGAVVGNKEKTC